MLVKQSEIGAPRHPDQETDARTPVLPDSSRRQQAAVALLMQVALADGVFTPRERGILETIIARRCAISDDAAGRLIDAWQPDADQNGLERHAQTLLAALDPTERLDLVGEMWTLAFANGRIDDGEDRLIWQVAYLLGVDSDWVELRRRFEAARLSV